MKKTINIAGLCEHRVAEKAAEKRMRSYSQHDTLSDTLKKWYEQDREERNAARAAFTAQSQTLTAAIEDAEAKARVRCITAENIIDSLLEIEDLLKISKKAMNGITVTVDHNAQNFPSAYKGTPESTQFNATYRSGAWRITDIYRYSTRRASQRIVIEHTDASKAAIIERMTTIE